MAAFSLQWQRSALVASTITSGADVFIRLLFVMPIEAASPLVMNKMWGFYLTLRRDVRFTVCLFCCCCHFTEVNITVDEKIWFRYSR